MNSRIPEAWKLGRADVVSNIIQPKFTGCRSGCNHVTCPFDIFQSENELNRAKATKIFNSLILAPLASDGAVQRFSSYFMFCTYHSIERADYLNLPVL